MTYLVTAHSTKPGREDLYEEFLKQRKLWFVRCLPGIKNYKVYRTEQPFPPNDGNSKEVRFNIIAVIEFDGNAEQAMKLYNSNEWIDFMEEYMDLLEDNPVLYIAHEVPEVGRLSKEEFKREVANELKP